MDAKEVRFYDDCIFERTRIRQEIKTIAFSRELLNAYLQSLPARVDQSDRAQNWNPEVASSSPVAGNLKL